jgi:hypothetical protein
MALHHEKVDITLSGRIKKFDEEYERIQLFIKDKVIKNEIYLGEKPVTTKKINEIISFNLSTELVTMELMQEQTARRCRTTKSRNGPSVRVIDNRLQWNKSRNQPQITYMKGLQKLLRRVRSLVMQQRFKKISKVLGIYRSMREEENSGQPQTRIINNKHTEEELEDEDHWQPLVDIGKEESEEHLRELQEY